MISDSLSVSYKFTMKITKLLAHFTLAERTLALSSADALLRKIEVNLQPQLPHPFIAYERANLEEDELLERALGVQHANKANEKRFHDTLGLQAWPSGFVAARKVLDILPHDKRCYKVLELGCGTGIPSLAVYNAGAMIVATDLDVTIISRSFREQASKNNKTYQCKELNLLDKVECEKTIQRIVPNLVVAADCLYDATLAKAVGETMGLAADRYACSVLVTDPGRLNGQGRTLFLDSFYNAFENTQMTQCEESRFKDVEMPQDLLKATGASLSWCGVLETKVGIFMWP